MKFRMIIYSILLMGSATIFIPQALQSQIVVKEGRSKPSAMLDADWYLDTLSHGVWYKKEGNWNERYDYNITKIVGCNGVVLLKSKNEDWKMVTNSGKHLLPVTSFQCLENISCINFNSLHFFFVDSTFLGMNWGDSLTQKKHETTVGGFHGHCVTAIDFHLSLPFDNRHAWGILGLNGKWLIEPIYDSPFIFQNGFAEVIYYGEKRKINEMGEFVE